MRIEILIFAITSFFVINTYYDGKYTKMLMSWKKYYQMIFYGVLGVGIYWMLKKNPQQSRNILLSANNFVKTLPFDHSATDMLQPILDFTRHRSDNVDDVEPFDNNGYMLHPSQSAGMNQGMKRMLTSGKMPTKRSVSETKKKYVASEQDWKCDGCGAQLNHTFEIDHKVRLEYGGSNEVSNLVALCRNCHGNKTAMENM